MDVFDKEKRSEVMGRIRAKDTKPEMVVRKFLHANGFRYRVHDKSLPGNPDIRLGKYNTVIFIHGCFWHSHAGCKDGRIPKSNSFYWKQKLERNIKRDAESIAKLRTMGWKVIIIWACEVSPKNADRTLAKLLKEITSAVDL